MTRDMKQRITLARVDGQQRRNKVDIARKHIYEKNHLVEGAAVENLLKEESLVPTAVRIRFLEHTQVADATGCLECIFR